MAFLVASWAILALASWSSASSLEINGAGTTNPQRYLWRVGSILSERSRKEVRFTYRGIGSGGGVTEFKGNAANNYTSFNDYASADYPFPDPDYTSLTTGDTTSTPARAPRTTMQLPFLVGAVGVFVSVPNTGSLQMSPCLLARIMLGNITTWDDTAITSENPSLVVPPGTPIHVVRRSDSSSSTNGLTLYLHSACPIVWNSTLVGPNPTSWVVQSTVVGSDNMIRAISGTKFTIGYVEAGQGTSFGLSEVALQNANGTYILSENADLAAQVMDVYKSTAWPQSVTESWVNVSLINRPGPTTFPIVLATYLFVDVTIFANATAFQQLPVDFIEKMALLRAMFDFVMSDEGQALTQSYLFEPLPTDITLNLRQQLEQVIPLSLFQSSSFNFTYYFESSASPNSTYGWMDNTFSARRRDYVASMVDSLTSDVADIKTRLARSLTRVLDGSGSASPQAYFSRIALLLEDRARVPMKITYRAVGSDLGETEFLDEANAYAPVTDFGCGELPLSAASYQALQNAVPPRGMIHVPIMVGGVAFYHNLPFINETTGPLNLTGCLLGKIFNATITQWNDPEILAANANLGPALQSASAAALQIHVLHRNSSSSTTFAVTHYLQDVTTRNNCAAAYALGTGSLITWPTDPRFTVADSSAEMVQSIRGLNGSIGYLELGLAKIEGLQEVWIQKIQDPTQFRSSDSASLSSVLQSASFPANPTADFSSLATDFINVQSDVAWPMTLVTYLWMRTDLTNSGQSGAVLRAFGDFILSTEGQQILADYSFEPLPADNLTYARNALDYLILDPTATEFSFEDSGKPQTDSGAGPTVISANRERFVSSKLAVLDQVSSQTLADLADIKLLGNGQIVSDGIGIAAIQAAIASLQALIDRALPRVLDGSGSTVPQSFLARMGMLMEDRASVPMKIGYRGVGADEGLAEFVNQAGGFAPLSDFGCSEIPLSAAQYGNLASAGVQVVHVPIMVSGVGFFHNLPFIDETTGPLNLTDCMLAQIFDARITTWDDESLTVGMSPALLARLANATIEQRRIKVVHRSISSSTTLAVTNYLNATTFDICPPFAVGVGANVTWAPINTFFIADAPEQMAELIGSMPGSIGYVELGLAKKQGLKEVWIQKIQTPTQFRSSDSATAAAALVAAPFPANPTADFSSLTTSFINMQSDAAWPLTLVTYLLMRTDLTKSGQSGAVLRALADFILSTEGQQIVADYGEPLPAAKLAYARAALSNLQLDPTVPLFTFESGAGSASGSSATVISANRQNFVSSKLAVLDQVSPNQLEALATTSTGATVTTTVVERQTTTVIERQTTTTAGSGSSRTAAAAIAIAIIALILAIVALIWIGSAMKKIKRAQQFGAGFNVDVSRGFGGGGQGFGGAATGFGNNGYGYTNNPAFTR